MRYAACVNFLLVHGWMVTGQVWSRLAPELDAAVVAPTSIPPPSEVETTTLDSLATRVLDQATRAGLDRFDLIGHSMGGQVAQLVAAIARPRVRSLVLVNPVPLSGLPLPAEVAAVFRGSGGNRAAQGAILDQASPALTPEAKQALLDDAATIPPAWIARALDLFVAGGDETKLANITCPTLVVATDDPFLPPAFLEQAVVSKIAGARLATLRGPGHYPQVERPDALAELVRAFLAEAAR